MPALPQVNAQRSRAAFLAGRFLELRSGRLTFGNISWTDLPASDETSEELRCAVARYARVLRELGEPPERVIVHVKEFASEVSGACGVEDREAREAISSQFVRWTIDAYYADATARESPRR